MSNELLSQALRAICLTRDYVGEDILPPIEGWEWYDAGLAIAEAIPDDPWAKEFVLRIGIKGSSPDSERVREMIAEHQKAIAEYMKMLQCEHEWEQSTAQPHVKYCHKCECIQVTKEPV